MSKIEFGAQQAVSKGKARVIKTQTHTLTQGEESVT